LSLFTLNITGLLSKETTYVLSHLNKNCNWKQVEIKLFEDGLSPSENRSHYLVYQIRKRFEITNGNLFLPDLDELTLVASSNMSSLSKSQVYLVFLYCSDVIFSQMLDSVHEIYEHNKENPLITRNDIKSILTNNLKRFKKDFNPKTKENWIGKFLSILKEVNILIKKLRNEYFINHNATTRETWTFFALHSCFNEYQFLSSPFIKAFHVSSEEILKKINEGKDRNWVSYEVIENEDQFNISIESKYKNIREWIEGI